MDLQISNLLSMEQINAIPPASTIDILILAASVDSRGRVAIEELIKNSVNIQNIIVLDYKKFRPTDTASEDYKAYYSLKALPQAQYIPCESENDDCMYIRKLLLPTTAQIFLDITCISVPDLFRIFYVLNEFQHPAQFNVLYTEPKYYFHQEGVYFDYEQNLGERDYRPLDEYYTSAVSKDVTLVCFLGFDRFISKYIHENKEHTDVIAINGFPSFYPKLKDMSLLHNYELVSTIGDSCVQFSQANNPFSAYNILAKIHREDQNKLLDICVLGSKPMALGACIFALTHPDNVKVSYPFPAKYSNHTALEASTSWWYSFTLN